MVLQSAAGCPMRRSRNCKLCCPEECPACELLPCCLQACPAMLLQTVAGFPMRRGRSGSCAGLQTVQLQDLQSAFMLLEAWPAVLLQSVAGCLTPRTLDQVAQCLPGRWPLR